MRGTNEDFFPLDREYTEEFDLKLPRDIVPGSVYPTVTIIGNGYH